MSKFPIRHGKYVAPGVGAFIGECLRVGGCDHRGEKLPEKADRNAQDAIARNEYDDRSSHIRTESSKAIQCPVGFRGRFTQTVVYVYGDVLERLEIAIVGQIQVSGIDTHDVSKLLVIRVVAKQIAVNQVPGRKRNLDGKSYRKIDVHGRLDS